MRKNIKGVTPTADEQAECRRDVPPGIETTAKPVKNWQRFNSREEAMAAHKKEGVVFSCGWGEIEWLYMDYLPDEPRIGYLKRLERHFILRSNGYAELKKREKAAKKGGAK